MVFTSGKQSAGGGFTRLSFFDISGRATFDSSYVSNPSNLYDVPGGNDIIIGKDFDGWICEPRISRSDNNLGTDHGGHRYSTTFSYANQWESPNKPYTRMYPFSFYVSNTNEYYGHYANVDAAFEVDNTTYLPYLYFNDDNEFAEKYNNYFAIDLRHRYDIDIVRRYGSADDHLFTKTANVIYSNVDTDNPYDAFMSQPAFDTDDSFNGYASFLNTDRWTISENIKSLQKTYLALENGRLQHRVDSNVSSCSFYSNFGFKGDFEIEVKLGKISTQSIFNWWASFRVDLSDEVLANVYTAAGQTTAVYARMEYRSDTVNRSL